MSSDNGIYIAQFPDGFRVIHAQAIDNLNYFEEGTEDWKNEFESYYGNAKVFKIEEEAVLFAHNLAKNYDVLEYGVSSIGYFDYQFKIKVLQE